MPEFKERPKTSKSKSRLATIPTKQVTRLMKEKYRQQLDQRSDKTQSETTYASDKMEDVGRQLTDTIKPHRSQPIHRRRQNPIKQKSSSAAPKESAKVTKDVHGPVTQSPTSVSSSKAADPLRPSNGSPRTEEAGRQTVISRQKVRPRGELSTSSSGSVPTKPSKEGQRSRLLKERPRTIFKRKAGPPGKVSGPAPKVKPAAKAVNAVKQTAQRRMRQQAIARAKQAAKAAVNVGKKATVAVAKAVASLVSSLVGLLGGGVLLVILIFIVAIAAIASSPFGIFFAGGDGTGGSSVATVSVSEAVCAINAKYNGKLEELQTGNYDSITLVGQAADWPDVLAVFASRYAAAEDGVDVATLDADRVSKLTATFWDMTSITSEVESIRHADSDPDDEIDDSWTERILHITVTPKTAEDMKTAYSFTAYQISALDELLGDRVALASLAGSLEITNADVKAIIDALPVDLPADRQKAVKTALQLVGKVNYFWGGKSYGIGWDSRWGRLTKVTADGSPTTGTYRPYGLDCSGFLDWTLRNAGLPSDGHWYVGTNLVTVSQADALPGDMALYPDASHIGLVVGRDSAGKLLICHCSSGRNNVVVTGFSASGFTVLGIPSIYSP